VKLPPAPVLFALAMDSLWTLLAVPVLWALLDRRVVPPEEARMAGLFGEDYAAYRKRVRRWL